MPNRRYIALLGSGYEKDQRNLQAAYEIGSCLAKKGVTLVCGGYLGCFSSGFSGAKDNDGATILILGESEYNGDRSICDHVLTTGVGSIKHDIIVNVCDGAIVVDGWVGTLILVSKFLSLGKPVVALNESGGVGGELSGKPLIPNSSYSVECATSGLECVNYIYQKIIEMK